MNFLPQEGTQLVLLGGLPGSGKTYFLKQLADRGWVIYDDFQAHAGNSLFSASLRYEELLSDLKSGRCCVVADIRMVHDAYRHGSAAALLEDVGKLASELHLFENDPEQCRRNVRNATDGRSVEPRLEKIEAWTRRYSAPSSAIIHPVWCPTDKQARA